MPFVACINEQYVQHQETKQTKPNTIKPNQNETKPIKQNQTKQKKDKAKANRGNLRL